MKIVSSLLVWMSSLAILATPAIAGLESGQQKASNDYQLQAGDIVHVQIFQEPDLERELRVSQDGALMLPLVGKVDVRGRSLGAVEQSIRDLYDRDYLVNPQVTMTVVKYQVRTVNVIGAVNAPQAVEYPPEQSLSLLDAISRAGGFNRFADRKKVRLTRTFPDGHTENYIINTDQLIVGSSGDRWALVKDDVVFVPESVL